MDEPEDLLNLVLGMTSPSLFRELFWEGTSVPTDSLASWFDQKTARFGGNDVLETVRNLVGNSARFDFQEVSDQIPLVDLPALAPFLKTLVTLNGRQVRETPDGLSFRTPDAWLRDPGVRTAYDGLLFDRNVRSRDAAQRVVGVGHRAMDQAIAQAKSQSACVATLPGGILERPLLLFTINDSVTTEGGISRSVIAGMEWDSSGRAEHHLLRDWEVVLKMNRLLEARGFRRAKTSVRAKDIAHVARALEEAEDVVRARLGELDLPFKIPMVAPQAVLWPDDSGGTSREGVEE
jgi:hypothetical protein